MDFLQPSEDILMLGGMVRVVDEIGEGITLAFAIFPSSGRTFHMAFYGFVDPVSRRLIE